MDLDPLDAPLSDLPLESGPSSDANLTLLSDSTPTNTAPTLLPASSLATTAIEPSTANGAGCDELQMELELEDPQDAYSEPEDPGPEDEEEFDREALKYEITEILFAEGNKQQVWCNHSLPSSADAS